MKKLLTVAVSATFLFGACGGSSSSGAQGDVADMFIDIADEEGLALDNDCVRDTSAKLSDDDAQALVDAGVDGDADISDEGDAIGNEIFTSCIDADEYIDFIVESFTEDDATIDGDCMRDEFSGLTVEEVDDKLFDAAFACSSE